MAPEGEIYQAGTLSGNPLAMAAGIATLEILKKGNLYTELEEKSDTLFSGLRNAAGDAGIQVVINRVGSMGTLFFTAKPVSNFADAKESNQDLFKKYYRRMLEQGIYLAPSPFEASFLSAAHTNEMIEKTIRCASKAFRNMLE